MTDIKSLVRPNVVKLAPYSSARDEFTGKEGIFLDANENPYGSLNRYPDPYQKELKTAISKLKNVPAANIFLGNGSDEIIDLCFRTFCTPGKDKALTFYPTYGMYEVSAGVNDVEMIRLPLDDSFQIDEGTLNNALQTPDLKLIFICSPNNPSGNNFKRETINYIIDSFKGIVIIDEAYSDFSSHKSFREEIALHPNLIVMQTFSKALGLAGVRVGMAFSSEEIISYFNKIKPPYNISSVNQKTVLRALADKRDNSKQIEKIISERQRLAGKLQKLSLVLCIYPSDSNFLLIRVTDAHQIYNHLVSKKIIVRNRTSVVRNCLRITVGKRSENDMLLAELKKFEE